MRKPAVTAIVILATMPLMASADRAVYINALESLWQNWSWGTTLNFANGIPAHGSSGASISAQYTGA